MNTAQLIHDIWIDGGNTQGLLQKVNYAYSWDTYELYADLISKSPYLSDSVLLATIYQTNALPDIMVKYILIANPQSLSNMQLSGAIYDYRYNMFSSFAEEESYITDTVSPRQQLEANVSYYTSQRKIYLNLLKKYYLADTTGNGLNNLINLLSNETDIRSLYELVFAQISNQNIKGSTSTLAAIGNQIDPDKQPEEMDKFNKMNAIIPALISIDTGDSTWGNISDFTKSLLIDYSVNDRGLPGSIATAIRLHFDSTFVYDEPIYTYDDDTTSRMAKLIKKVNKPLSEETYLKISPNPANEYIIVSYNITSAINGLRLFIIDASGKTLFEKELNKAKDQQILTVKNYANGNYICTLFNNGKPIKSEKFIKN